MALKTFCFKTKLKVLPQISLIFPMNDCFFTNPNYPQVSLVSTAGLWKVAWLYVKNPHLRHFYKKKLIKFTVRAVQQYLSVWDKLQIEKYHHKTYIFNICLLQSFLHIVLDKFLWNVNVINFSIDTDNLFWWAELALLDEPT